MNRTATAGAMLSPASLPPRDDIRAELLRDREAIDEALIAAIGSRRTRIERVARRGLLDGGKRVRPLMTCAVLRALGEDPGPHIELVIAVEMAHAGSLLHDDIIDGSRTRRGHETGHIAFDVPTAVLAGDRLVVLGVELLAAGGTEQLLAPFCAAVRDLCIGESLERDRRHDVTVGLEHAREVNRLKTAALFAYAAEAGAVLADAPPRVRRAARAYGRALGEAFQAKDDHLDFCGDPDAMGKPMGRDLVDGVVTVPVAVALERSPAVRDQVLAVWRARDRNESAACLARLRERLQHVGALDETLRLAAGDAARAAASTRSFPPSPWRDRMAAFAHTLVVRDR